MARNHSRWLLRLVIYCVAISLFVLGMSKLSFAMRCGEHSSGQKMTQVHSEHEHGTKEAAKEAELSEKAVDVGNQICPVSGEKIKQEEKVTYEYEGKIYNFCCAHCIEEFKKDPEKYIKKVDEELKAEPKEDTTEKHIHGGHQH